MRYEDILGRILSHAVRDTRTIPYIVKYQIPIDYEDMLSRSLSLV